MYGLDRACIYADVQTDILYVRERIKILFPKSFSESLSNHNNSYKIDEKNINFIKVEEKKIKKETTIKIDFSYPRFFSKDNVIPLDSELEKILVEQKILKIFKDLIDYEISEENLKYEYFEFTLQEKIKHFYEYHNIISIFYKSLTRKFRDIDKIQYYNFNKIENKFYTTGFIFQPFQGWKIRLYSKSHEHNKKSEDKIIGTFLRLEHRISKKLIKDYFLTNSIKYISIQGIKDFIKVKISKILAEIIVEEIEKSVDILKQKFKNFRCQELDSLVRDNLEWIFDYKILDDIITSSTNKSYRQIIFYRQKIKKILSHSQEFNSPKRSFFNNLERLELFFNNLILSDIKVKCNTKKHLTFFCKNRKKKLPIFEDF